MIFVISAAAAFLILAAVAFFAGSHMFKVTVVKKNTSLKRTQGLSGVHWERYDDMRLPMFARLKNEPCSEHYIVSFDGVRLHGRYIESKAQRSGGARKIFICFHGYTSQGIGNNTAIACRFLDSGYDVLLPDARAHGESGGDYIGFGVLDRYDGLSWIEFLRERFSEEDRQGRLQIFLYGVSMGGATVCMISGLELPECVRGFVSDCAFTSPKELFAYLLRRKYHLPPAPILFFADIICRLRAGYSISEGSSAAAMRINKRPALLFHGAEDKFIPPQMCEDIAAAGDDCRRVLIEGADHAEAYYKDPERYEAELNAFLQRFPEAPNVHFQNV